MKTTNCTRPLPGRILALVVLCCFSTSGAFAQTTIPVEQLLLEPIPLPEDTSRLPDFDYMAPGTAASILPDEPPDRSGPAAEDPGSLESIREIEAYLASVDDTEAEDGPFSPQLRENLISLGQLYQQQGAHEQALQQFERALNISRNNEGLNTLDQVPVIQAMVPSYTALEQHDKADEMQDLVLELHKDVYGPESPEIVPAMEELGEWNVQAFLDRSNIVTNIQRVDAQRFIMDPKNYSNPVYDPRSTPLFKLYQAQSLFLNAVNILIQEKSYTHPRLLPLERKLVSTYFLKTHRENILYEPDFYLTRKKRKTGSRLDQNAIERMNSEEYELGQASLKRSIAYIVNDPEASPHQLGRAMLEDADWDLLYSRKVKAARKYEEAYKFFHDNPQLEAAITDLIYPDVPKVLPVYLPAPNSREKLGIPSDEEVEYIGYFDVSFVIDEFGKASNIEILDKGGAVTGNMEIRMNQYLRKVQFRPRFSEGRPADEEVLTYRYNVGY